MFFLTAFLSFSTSAVNSANWATMAARPSLSRATDCVGGWPWWRALGAPGLACIDLFGQELEAEQCAGDQPLVGRVAVVAHRRFGQQLVDSLPDGHGFSVSVPQLRTASAKARARA